MSPGIDFEACVIGAGVVGIAVARKLVLEGISTLLVESEPSFGYGTSSRNSEVLHAGIYYPENSLKAKFCRVGNQQTVEYCEARNVAFKKIGKLIVSDSANVESLDRLMRTGLANGVPDLYLMDKSEVGLIEPLVECEAALYSPSTAIIDSHSYMQAMLADFVGCGGTVAFNTRFCSATCDVARLKLTMRDVSSGESVEIKCSKLINCGGLGAWSINSSVDSEISHEGVRGPFYCKGNYYSYNRKSPFSHLIYPLPSSAGLGIHATHDLAGQLKFGPNTRWIEGEDYSVDEGLEGIFADAISEYFPKISASDLSPDYAGIRPKLVSSGEPAGDFDIRQSHDQSGSVTYVGLYGIESPGLTCAQPLADEIHNLIWKMEKEIHEDHGYR